MWASSYLLPDHGGAVVRELMRELEESEEKAHKLQCLVDDLCPEVGPGFVRERENAFPILD